MEGFLFLEILEKSLCKTLWEKIFRFCKMNWKITIIGYIVPITSRSFWLMNHHQVIYLCPCKMLQLERQNKYIFQKYPLGCQFCWPESIYGRAWLSKSAASYEIETKEKPNFRVGKLLIRDQGKLYWYWCSFLIAVSPYAGLTYLKNTMKT